MRNPLVFAVQIHNAEKMQQILIYYLVTDALFSPPLSPFSARLFLSSVPPSRLTHVKAEYLYEFVVIFCTVIDEDLVIFGQKTGSLVHYYTKTHYGSFTDVSSQNDEMAKLTYRGIFRTSRSNCSQERTYF